MSRNRITIGLALGGGFVALLVAMELTGSFGGRSITGAARGVGANGGCEGGLPVVEEGEILVGKPIQAQTGLSEPSNIRAGIIPGEYIVKLSQEIADKSRFQNSHVVTELPTLNVTLSKLATSVEDVHPLPTADGRSFGLGGTLHIRTTLDEKAVAELIATEDNIDWYEPVYAMKAFADAPDDPYYPYQWHLSTMGIPDAWNVSKGEGVVVAVVDSGVDFSGLDNFVSVRSGWDFVDKDNDAADLYGHGTHIAGIIAQSTDNGIGVAGIAPMATILPVRVLDKAGNGTSDDVAEGIRWAADNGANIIVLSLGTGTSSTVIEEACGYAWMKGLLVVAAAGNDAYTDFVSFPAAGPSTFAVGATDLNGDVAWYSNRGSTLDIVAPGGSLKDDVDGDGFVDGILQETFQDGIWANYYMEGTSMAAAEVAGVAALLMSKGVKDPEQLQNMLTSTAQDVGEAGFDNEAGFGLLNPMAAIRAAVPPAPISIFDLRSMPLRAGRALVEWKTTTAASGELKLDDGTVVASLTEPARLHRFRVYGAVGTQIQYKATSALSDGTKVSSILTVQF